MLFVGPAPDRPVPSRDPMRPARGRVRAWLAELRHRVRRQYEAGPPRWAKIIGWTLGALFVITAADVVFGSPRLSQIRALPNMPQATAVFDVNNQQVFTIFTERRLAVPLSEISPNMVNAVIAVEDQRFFAHSGLDPIRIAGAMVANFRNSDETQGGSTITQQLARKSFLSDKKSIRRKLKEMFVAIRIERQFTKNEILQAYLNKVYFGDGFHGVEAASRGYFNKPAKALTIDEAALLAGLIQAPSALSPTKHLDRAIARRATVLRRMAEAGFIDAATASALASSKVTLVNGFQEETTGQYFKNHIVRLLVERFGWETVSKGGLKVYSTIDGRMQKVADDVVAKGLDATEKSRAYRHHKRGDARTIRAGQSPDYLQGALVAIDPRTGEVRAMVGGRNFGESQFDRAVQAKRQPGSAFKPFVYAAALESGYSPATLLTDLDAPVNVPSGAWLPDDGHSATSAMTVRTALRTSSNRAAVRVLRDVGIPRAVSYVARLGLDAPPVPSLVLGTGDVTVLSMVAAFGAFANGGWMRPPVFIKRVEDANGSVLFTDTTASSHAMSEETAFLMANILADVVNSGTGYRAREAGFHHQAAGKTGTSNEYRDAWFVGFTPALVTGVWVGFDDPKTIVPGGYAGQLAAPIWGRFMKQATPRDAGWIKRPSGIDSHEICRVSGMLPAEGCYRTFTVDKDGMPTDRPVVGFEYFRRGTAPREYCTLHESWTSGPRDGYPVAFQRWRRCPESSLLCQPSSSSPSRSIHQHSRNPR